MVQAVTVASWSVVEREAPQVAAIATRLWPGPFALDQGLAVPTGQPTFAVAYLATVRRDGAPRLHPFCPIVADGRLFAAIPRRSPKGSDLRRDPRCVIHATPGPDDDELCIRATASDVTADAATTAVVRTVVARSDVGGMLQSVRHDPIFEFDLIQVDVAHWVNVGQPGTHAVREQWRQRGR
jgi:Pyridoxamine 5'-phosphate oxidase